MLSLCPIDNCEDAPVSTCVPDTSWTISWQNRVPLRSFVPALYHWVSFFFCSVPCQSNTSVFMCLTGQPSLHFWYFLTFSSLFPRCCQVHDNCYSQAMKLELCRFLVDNPYTKLYSFSCSSGQITCNSMSTSTSLCFKRYSHLSSEGTGLHYTPCFCGRKAQCKSLPRGLVVRNGAPHTGTRVNILRVAHNLKFMKTYRIAVHREACPLFRGLSPCGAFLGLPLTAVFKRSAREALHSFCWTALM